jgi:hypothetical protein
LTNFQLFIGEKSTKNLARSGFERMTFQRMKRP